MITKRDLHLLYKRETGKKQDITLEYLVFIEEKLIDLMNEKQEIEDFKNSLHESFFGIDLASEDDKDFSNEQYWGLIDGDLKQVNYNE